MTFTKNYLPFIFAIVLTVFITGCSDIKESSDNSIHTVTSSSHSVEEAILENEGTTLTVEGFIVGQPVSTSNVETGNFTNDYALALSDKSGEEDMDKMIFVQIPSEFRELFGLKTNTELMGKKLKVTGGREGYFAHPGIKSTSAMEILSFEESPEEDEEEKEPPVVEDPYYEGAKGKTGSDLKSALHDIIDDHRELSYDGVWKALSETDQDPGNPDNVILLYTGRSQSKLLNGGGSDDWNREHVWAKSHGGFGTSQGAGTDLHHLRPTDTTVNSSRSNLDFDNGGAPHQEAIGNFSDSDSWEPRDEVKGDIARMLFYMAVRYEGDNGELDLELNDKVENGSSPVHGKISVLLEWHSEDPVDEREIRRNNLIFENYQGNRNPFIDYPEWAEMIW